MNMPYLNPVRTVANLLHELGDIPAKRVRLVPTPGTATIDDLLKPENGRCELVDGTLVEKPVGQPESRLALWLGMVLNQFVIPRNLGYVTGETGFVELPSGPVRGPDVAFFAWDGIATRRAPTAPIPRMAPDLAVEVLSPSNTKREMERKREDYFGSGVRLVWEIDPRSRTVRAYTALDQFRDLTATDTLTGDPVLPGFALPLADLFAELDRHG
jgi:Uma2 family endonuclease